MERILPPANQRLIAKSDVRSYNKVVVDRSQGTIRTVFLGRDTRWPSLEREVARAQRAGELVVFTGKGDWARRLTKRLYETYPNTHRGFDTETKEHSVIVGWDAQTVIGWRISPARPA
jgi:hypothetical protein